MTSNYQSRVYGPGWHESARTPVVDGKHIDPQTGEVRTSTGAEYSGPPAVDLYILSIEEKTMDCGFRIQTPFTVEAVLWQIMKVLHERKITIDSLTATNYAVRLLLSHEMTPDEFDQIRYAIVDGLWEENAD